MTTILLCQHAVHHKRHKILDIKTQNLFQNISIHKMHISDLHFDGGARPWLEHSARSSVSASSPVLQHRIVASFTARGL